MKTFIDYASKVFQGASVYFIITAFWPVRKNLNYKTRSLCYCWWLWKGEKVTGS